MMSATDRPRLSEADTAGLRKVGVTAAQVLRLDRKLPSIARALADPPTRSDVMGVLKRAEDAAAELVRIADATALPAQRAALAHLASACEFVEAEPVDGSGQGTLPEVPDFEAAARMLLNMAREAKKKVKPGQRRGRADPGAAVYMLLLALHEPQDEESQAFARRVRPDWRERKRNPFAEVASIVFGCVMGTDDVPLQAAVDAWKRRPGREVGFVAGIAVPRSAIE